MDEGYIISNKFRREIFDSLVSGEKNIRFIAKKHRIIYTVAENIIKDFVKNGIVEKKQEGFVLTKDGEKLAEKI
jgi:predicted transcriptional regulator